MPNDALSLLGARLKTARKERNLTQEHLAELSGRSIRHIANIEKGNVNPSFKVLSALVKVLGVSYNAILDPASERVETEIQEIAELYRACPEQERRLILAAIRAMAKEAANPKQEAQQARK